MVSSGAQRSDWYFFGAVRSFDRGLVLSWLHTV
jgi:hypothetical protein